MKRLLAEILIIILFLQPLGFISSVHAETVEMKYIDPDHLHAPKEVNGAVYQYDENGNLKGDGERIISWNQDNLPVRIEKDGQIVEFFYDADGRRIAKKVGENKTVYVNQYLTIEQLNNETIPQKYYFANGMIGQSTSDNLSFLHQNYLGSTILATDTNSQPLGESLSYFPYGNFVNNETMKQWSNYLFTNQELDSETDLYNYNARLYNPKTGAFISADTAQGLNRYAYAANNPVLFTDPSGHQPAYDPGLGGAGYTPPLSTVTVGFGDFAPTAVANTTAVSSTQLSSYYYSPGYQRALREQMIDFTIDFITIGLATYNLMASVPAIISYLQFAKDYYYYNYAREPILRVKTFVQTLKPGNLVVRLAYTGEIGKDTVFDISGETGGRLYAYKLPGLAGSGEIALSEKNWERYQSGNLCPAFVHEGLHWKGFVESGGENISGDLATALEEIRIINAEIEHYRNLEAWGYVRPGELSELIESRQRVLSAWENVVESIR